MIQPRCPEGQSYCYCTGLCGIPGEDKCQEYRTGSLAAKLAASGAKLVLAYDPVTKKSIAHDDCWATDNLLTPGPASRRPSSNSAVLDPSIHR